MSRFISTRSPMALKPPTAHPPGQPKQVPSGCATKCSMSSVRVRATRRFSVLDTSQACFDLGVRAHARGDFLVAAHAFRACVAPSDDPAPDFRLLLNAYLNLSASALRAKLPDEALQAALSAKRLLLAHADTPQHPGLLAKTRFREACARKELDENDPEVNVCARDAVRLDPTQPAYSAFLATLAAQKNGTIPVTLLSGFLGAGKTTLMKRVLLEESAGKRVAIVVNDMASINVDAEIIAHAARVETSNLIEMSNGCICCTLREDFARELGKLAASEPRFDAILVESTGISEPMPVAQVLVTTATALLHVDCLVTVADASQFLANTRTRDTLRVRRWHATEEDERRVSRLQIEQVEFANVIVLNKTDLVGVDELRQVRGLIAQLNPRAKIYETTRCVQVPLARVTSNCRVFDMKRAVQGQGWNVALNERNGSAVVADDVEGSFSSWVYASRAPFANRGALLRALSPDFAASHFVRCKGFCFFADDAESLWEFQSAGPNIELARLGEWKGEPEVCLVFIGFALNAREIELACAAAASL